MISNDSCFGAFYHFIPENTVRNGIFGQYSLLYIHNFSLVEAKYDKKLFAINFFDFISAHKFHASNRTIQYPFGIFVFFRVLLLAMIQLGCFTT